jgi:hypothetical protein
MRDGTVMRGTVERQAPGQYVIIRTSQGEQTLTWDIISRVVVAQGSAPPAGQYGPPATQSQGIVVGQSGLGAGYTKETVEKVKEPSSSSINFQLDGGFMAGVGSTSLTLGGQINASLPILVGGKFPGSEGGSWWGLRLVPTVGILGGAFGTTDGSDEHGSLFAWKVGGTAAVQYLHFGTLDPQTLKQHGFGIALGGYAGAQGSTVNVSVMGMSNSSSSTDGSYGPSLDITFPSYNAGTAKYSSLNILLFVLPTGDFTFFTASFAWVI